MSDRKLAILAVVAVVMVILAVIQSHISSGPPKAEIPGYLMPAVNTARVGIIVIGKGDDIVTIKQMAEQFVVTNKDNYPAKVSEINNLLTKCQEIRWSQFITDNPANHKDLQVTEQDARSVVKFLTPEPNSTILAGVVVGKTRETGEGTYVRLLSGDKASSNKVYLAQDVPWFNNQVMNYIEQELISCKFEDINSVTVASSDGEYTLKAKQDGKDIVLENTPQGKKLKSSDGRSVFTALTDLRFEDVVKKTSGLLFDKKFICRLKNSVVYTIDIAQKDNQAYIICHAAFTDTVEKPKQDESQEELKKKEAKLLAWEKASEFSQKHQGWVYKIADYKAKSLTKLLSDLLEDDNSTKETEKPAEPNSVEVGELIDSLELPNMPDIEDNNVAETEQ